MANGEFACWISGRGDGGMLGFADANQRIQARFRLARKHFIFARCDKERYGLGKPV
jgi:hypothetical protein